MKSEQQKLQALQQVGDPMAVAKQQINAETVKNELRHYAKNRTTDFIFNPKAGKLNQATLVTMTVTVFESIYYTTYQLSQLKSTQATRQRSRALLPKDNLRFRHKQAPTQLTASSS